MTPTAKPNGIEGRMKLRIRKLVWIDELVMPRTMTSRLKRSAF
jgi:hypothetical protein